MTDETIPGHIERSSIDAATIPSIVPNAPMSVAASVLFTDLTEVSASTSFECGSGLFFSMMRSGGLSSRVLYVSRIRPASSADQASIKVSSDKMLSGMNKKN